MWYAITNVMTFIHREHKAYIPKDYTITIMCMSPSQVVFFPLEGTPKCIPFLQGFLQVVGHKTLGYSSHQGECNKTQIPCDVEQCEIADMHITVSKHFLSNLFPETFVVCLHIAVVLIR